MHSRGLEEVALDLGQVFGAELGASGMLRAAAGLRLRHPYGDTQGLEEVFRGQIPVCLHRKVHMNHPLRSSGSISVLGGMQPC